MFVSTPPPAPLAVCFRPALLASLLLGGAALGSGAAAQSLDVGGRRCAVEAPALADVARATQVVRQWRALRPALRVVDEPVVVPVAFHVLTAGGEGATDAQVTAQMDVLNAAFAGVGVRFVLAAYDRTENAAWADRLRINSADERAMKRALALDPAVYLNLYTAAVLDDDYLGWATLPYDPDAGTVRDGVVVGGGTLPGGDEAPFNEGDTGVHEVGHWLGLEHTFAGGCSEPNDGVADTPWQRSSTSGCPVGRDSCRPSDERPDGQFLGAAAEGLDPIHNFMDYSDDACMTGFTPGQRERMRALTASLRPAVAAGRVLAAVSRTAFGGAVVGESQTAPLRVVNTTSAPVTVTAVRASHPAFTVGGVGTAVAPGGVAVLDLAFAPSEPGVVVATVTVETDGAEAASATVVGTAALDVMLPEGRTAEARAVVTNAGAAPLAFSVGATPPWVLDVVPAEGTVAPGSSAALAVTVSGDSLVVPPGEREGRFDGTVAVVADGSVLRVPVVAVVSALPDAFAVGDPYPNPGRGRITVPLAFPDAADGVTVEVFDALGRRVAVLAEGASFAAGVRELTWDAGGVPAGLYLVQARTAGGADAGRVVVAR